MSLIYNSELFSHNLKVTQTINSFIEKGLIFVGKIQKKIQIILTKSEI